MKYTLTISLDFFQRDLHDHCEKNPDGPYDIHKINISFLQIVEDITYMNNITCMYTNMNLLRTARTKSLPEFPARKLPSRNTAVTMSMVHQTSTIRKILSANIARHDFIPEKIYTIFPIKNPN